MVKMLKYRLRSELKLQSIQMIHGASVVSVDPQGREIVLYAKVDADEKRTVSRTFLIVGTGVEFQEADAGEFLDTVMLMDDSLVYHVFESTVSVRSIKDRV